MRKPVCLAAFLGFVPDRHLDLMPDIVMLTLASAATADSMQENGVRIESGLNAGNTAETVNAKQSVQPVAPGAVDEFRAELHDQSSLRYGVARFQTSCRPVLC
ncbi:hypothetical protein [Rhodanobacter koreensis]